MSLLRAPPAVGPAPRPCHHNLESYLLAHLEGMGINSDPKGPLFRTLKRGAHILTTRTPLPRANAYAMIQRRATDAGLKTRISNHSFRATGITVYLKTAVSWKKPPLWLIMPSPELPSSMISAPMK